MPKSGRSSLQARGAEPKSDAALGIEPAHRAFHELGRRVQEKIDGGLSRNAAVRAVDGAEVEPRGRAWVAHAFFLRFNDEALARLGRIGKALGRPLPMTCLRTLAMVPTLKLRSKYMAEIRQGGWDEARIVALIRKANPTPGTGGRRIVQPKSLADGLFEVEEWCRASQKRFEAAWPADAIWMRVPVSAKETNRVREIAKAVRQVARAALDLEERLATLAEPAGSRPGTAPLSKP